MTPTEVIAAARNIYNAVGDTFYSDAELFTYLYDACCDLAQEAELIEKVYSTTTVAGTQQYDLPTNTIFIKRVTYDGAKLQNISFREDDYLTGFNFDVTSQGTPQYYTEWSGSIYLRAIPSDALALKIYSYSMPEIIVETSVLEIPLLFHIKTVDYLLWRMAMKDQNQQVASTYRNIWETIHLVKAKAYQAKKKSTDSIPGVIDEDSLPVTQLGIV